ncbi:MAG: hypothetical protein EZS28_045718, partial [Streblomastix strix]
MPLYRDRLLANHVLHLHAYHRFEASLGGGGIVADALQFNLRSDDGINRTLIDRNAGSFIPAAMDPDREKEQQIQQQQKQQIKQQKKKKEMEKDQDKEKTRSKTPGKPKTPGRTPSKQRSGMIKDSQSTPGFVLDDEDEQHTQSQQQSLLAFSTFEQEVGSERGKKKEELLRERLERFVGRVVSLSASSGERKKKLKERRGI